MSVDRNSHDQPPQEMPVNQPANHLSLAFQGPYAWIPCADAPSIFDAIALNTSGIYLWSVNRGDGYLISYVGETGRCIHARMAEHYREHVAGLYSLNDPTDYRKGKKLEIWPGNYGKNKRDLGACVQASVELAPQILELSCMTRFFIAPTTCEKRIRRRVEAAIADALFEVPGIIGAFQDRGVRYERSRRDEPRLTISLAVPHGTTLLGLPDLLETKFDPSG